MILYCIFCFSIIHFSDAFSETTIRFEIAEDAPIDTIIGELHPDGVDSLRLSRGHSNIRFDPLNGRLSVEKRLDREIEARIEMLVVTNPPTIMHIVIDVLDTNDNAPRWTEADPQRVSLPETARVGWRVSIGGASDPDFGDNGTIGGYELIGAVGGAFGIVEQDGLVYLEVRQNLDRELVDFYELTIRASDNGVPQLSSTTTLLITIIDTNDNPPIFPNRSITVNWNGAPFTRLVKLNATDADLGENSRVEYELIDTNHLSIDTDNYLVTNNHTIQVCAPQCHATIRAHDSGNPPLSSTMNVIVELASDNKHDPSINIRFHPSDLDFIIVHQNDVNGKTLAILSVTDPDGPVGPNSTIWIGNGNEDGVFRLLSRHNIHILSLKSGEIAKNPEYELEFWANDGQEPNERIAIRKLSIFFEKFVVSSEIHVERELSIEIESDSPIGSFVAHIRTNCSNGCRFEMVQDLAYSPFVINPENGIITTNANIGVSNYHIAVLIHPPPPSTNSLRSDVLVRVRHPKSTKITPIAKLGRLYKFSTWRTASIGEMVGQLPRVAGVYEAENAERADFGVFANGAIYVRRRIGEDRFTRMVVVARQANSTQKAEVIIGVRAENPAPSCDSRSIWRIMGTTEAGNLIGILRSSDSLVSFEQTDSESRIYIIPKNGKVISRENIQNNFTFHYKVRNYGWPSKEQNCSCHVEFLTNHTISPFARRFFKQTMGKWEANARILKISNNPSDYEFGVGDSKSFEISKHGELWSTENRINSNILNISIYAVDLRDNRLFRNFVLLRFEDELDFRGNIELDMKPELQIYRNDEIGVKIGRIRVKNVGKSIEMRFDGAEFRVSKRNFDVILISNPAGIGTTNLEIIDPRNQRIIQKFKFAIRYFEKQDRSEFEIEEFQVTNSSEIQSILNQNGKIIRKINETPTDQYVFFENSKILHFSEKPTILEECETETFLILPPTQIKPECKNGRGLFIDTQSTILTNHSSHHPPLVTILNTPSDEVRFASSSILMLISSAHSIDTTFGRVTADSAYNVTYFLVGTTRVSINPVTGELFIRHRFYRDLKDLVIVAVIEKGISSAKLTIEVIEDHLHLPRVNFVVFGPPKIAPGTKIGDVRLERSDVMLDVIDEYFYTRNAELFAKKLPPIGVGGFYDFVGVVKKGKLSREINITVVFGCDSPFLSEDELAFFADENLRIGSVIGAISNKSNLIKYRLTDESGVRIDPYGLIRTTRVFDREKESLIKTKMLEIGGNKIWELLIFIEDLNDNPPRIRNIPKFLRISPRFSYQFMIEDLDTDSDFYWKILDGDAYQALGISENGTLFVNFEENLGFLEDQITIRVSDGAAPNNYHFTDFTIPIKVEKEKNDECENRTFWIIGRPPKIGDLIGTIETRTRRTFRIIPESDPLSQFSIDPMNGSVFVENRIETRIPKTYELTVETRNYAATDVQRCSVKIRVNVDEVNRNRDLRIHADREFRVSENSRIGTEIGKIGRNGDEEFRVFRIEGTDSNFTISPLDGTIYLNTILDFEQIPEYSINVSMLEYGSARILEHRILQIRIENENDEYPRFITGDVVELSIEEENILSSYPIIIGSSLAEDLDSPLLTYSILFGNTSLFAVNETSGEILSLQPVDRESLESHELIIESKDSGGNSATCKIAISVTDINDNSPEFEQPRYSSQIPENLPLNSKILEIRATDRDFGENARITYSIRDDALGMVRIDARTGWIYTDSRIDREQIEGFLFFVEAIDHGNPSRNSSVAVEIRIQDLNDNPPTILDTTFDLLVPNELTNGNIVHAIDFSDPDTDDTHTFSISGADQEFFTIDTYGIVRLNRPRLTTNSFFSIRIAIRDRVGQETAANYTLHLHPSRQFPTWIESIDSVTVVENQDQRVALFQASCADDPCPIRYSLVSPCRRFLRIGENDGFLETRSPDFEQFQKCPLCLIATTWIDGKAMRIHVESEIKIRDLNDNKPRFEKQLYRFNISENSGPATIGFVNATDLDEMENGRISYRIVEGDPLSQFRISESGKMETIGELDREQIATYHLVIQASDHGNPSNTANCSAVVTVLDEDDNPPRFVRIFHSELPEDASIGSLVIELSASDADQISDHRYSIEAVDSADPLPFYVEETSGKVYTNSSLDYEKKSSYRTKIRLSDGPWTIETSLFVSILDRNDNAPIFREKYVFFSDSGSVIADDADSSRDLNGQVRYSIAGNANYAIHPRNGIITRLRDSDLPWENVRVDAFDLGTPGNSARADVVFIRERNWKTREFRVRKSSEIAGKFSGDRNAPLIVHPSNAARIDHFSGIVRNPDGPDFKILDFDRLEISSYSIVEDSRNSNLEKNVGICKNVDVGAIVANLSSDECAEFEMIRSNFLLSSNGILRILQIEKTARKMVLDVTCNNGIIPKTWKNLTLTISFVECSERGKRVDPISILRKSSFPQIPCGLEKSLLERAPLEISATDSEVFVRKHRKISRIPLQPTTDCCSSALAEDFSEHTGFATNLTIDLGVVGEKWCNFSISPSHLFAITADLRLIPKIRLQPGTYQLLLRFEDPSRSTTSMAIHVLPEIADRPVPRVIYTRKFPSRPIELSGERLEIRETNREILRIPIKNHGTDYKMRIFKDPQFANLSDSLEILSFDQKISINMDVRPVGAKGCLEQLTESYQISESCHLSTNHSINLIHLRLMDELRNFTIFMKNKGGNRRISSKSYLEIEFYARQSAILRFWQDLQEYYDDMRIIAICASAIVPDYQYRLTIAIIDRNGRDVINSEARRTIDAFIERENPSYLELVKIHADPCHAIRCPDSEVCDPLIFEQSDRGVVSAFGDTILDVRHGILEARCSATRIDCGRNGKRDERNSKCLCYSGGFESKNTCDLENQSFSLVSSEMRVSIRNSSQFVSNCSQYLEMDLQTVSLYDNLFHVEYGNRKIVLELENGYLKMELFDEMRSTIVVRLEKKINDGNWHRIRFSMENNRRKMSIQIDGGGKEVKSRFDLPLIYEGILIFGKSTTCLKRIILQNRLIDPVWNFEEIHVSISGEIERSCGTIASSNLGFLADLNSYILILILLIILIIAILIALITVCRNNGEKSGKSEEIDAYDVANDGSTNENEQEVYVIGCDSHRGVVNMAYL